MTVVGFILTFRSLTKIKALWDISRRANYLKGDMNGLHTRIKHEVQRYTKAYSMGLWSSHDPGY